MKTPSTPPRTWDDLEDAHELNGVVWEYVARDDACDVGRELHGRRFSSLAEVYEQLPGFEGNPRCTRRPCTCTALPTRSTSPAPKP